MTVEMITIQGMTLVRPITQEQARYFAAEWVTSAASWEIRSTQAKFCEEIATKYLEIAADFENV